ncbi:metal ABC transporter ATP-binding protein [Aeromicrobium phragmitis]|uniref:Metal ABC transporter ATP-binding protein n=1 Tax=Aeromicrobium phragmitis TaxID=2478914 RepID=A0A3L8PLF0_9ACTN|nr:zinc ABC transporter ATP-binding protein AztA [Aeromicrobium phragmitis]RLV56236.1 metal ABC transporter ATP-binding protein [Aeromicrobium phragmitis]
MLVSSAATTAELRVRDVWFAYPNRPVLQGAELSVRAGEVTALRGDNGAGKSTLLDIVCGVRRPHRGTVELPGRIAYVPQRTDLDSRLPVTVRDVVMMGAWSDRGLWRPLRRSDRRAVQGAMERVGIDPLASRRLDELSGGQVQRTLMARALTTGAPVIILDEPTTGLDSEVRRVVADLLAELAAEGRVVLHATHDEEALRASDVVLHLAHGTISTPQPTASSVVE